MITIPKTSYATNNFLLFLTYFTVGGVTLIIADHHLISLIWPAAGVALGGILLGGYRYLPSILVGSLLLNLIVLSSLEVSIPLFITTSILLACCQSFQSGFGAFLVRQFTNKNEFLESEKEIGLLFFLGAIVPCIISSVPCTLILLFGGVTSKEHYLTDFFSWWISNTIGIILITPLMLITLGQNISIRRKIDVLIPSCIGFIIISTLILYSNHHEEEVARKNFKEHVLLEYQAIRNGMIEIKQVLSSIGNFYQASKRVNRKAFNTFVSTDIETHPEIIALEWIPRVSSDQKKRFEELAIDDGFRHFKIKEKIQGKIVPVKARAEYFPVYYVFPYQGNEKALGFDLGSNKDPYRALKIARHSGQQVATRGIHLVQSKNQDKGFLIFAPIYAKEMPAHTLRERWHALQGFALGVLNINEFIDKERHQVSNSIENLYIYDNYLRGKDAALYGKIDTEAPFSYSFILEVAGRQWTLVFSPTNTFLSNQDPWRLWATWIVSLTIAILFQIFLLTMTSRSEIIRKLVLKRTEQVEKSENQQRAIAERLKKANEDLREFVYIASHDLQEPLRVINSYLHLITEDNDSVLTEKSQDYIIRTTRATGNLQNLIKDLLIYSGIIDKAKEIEEIDLNYLFKQVMEIFSIKIKETETTITCDNLPLIYGDSTKINQLLQNLIGNAIKYKKPDTAPVIQITCEILQDHIIISIQDNGIGIKEKYYERIFQVFKRLHGKEEYEGTGIGLSICVKIVEQHNGRIWVESTYGEGSTFFVSLPINKN